MYLSHKDPLAINKHGLLNIASGSDTMSKLFGTRKIAISVIYQCLGNMLYPDQGVRNISANDIRSMFIRHRPCAEIPGPCLYDVDPQALPEMH